VKPRKNMILAAVCSSRVYKVEDGLMFVHIYPTKWKVNRATPVSTLCQLWCA